MSFSRSRMCLALVGVLLGACVSSSPGVREEAEAPEVVSSSWEEARADPSCVVPLCDGERCALWRCQDVAEVEAHPVLLAQVTVAEPVPEPILPESLVEGPSASRWWGRTLAGPDSADPVFEIPWHNWKAQEQSAPRPLRRLCINLLREPFEKHHIFPQQEELARWFNRQGVDIHAFTIRVPKSFHRWLHSGSPEGGQWNEAWRQFKKKNQNASPEEIWRFAGELMMRFGVNGPLVPYYCD